MDPFMNKYRGAFHLHTKYSYDGQIPIREMAEFLKQKGYSFALMSEHAYDRTAKRYLTSEEFQSFIRDCQNCSSPDFLMIPGLEFACCDNKVHILASPLYTAFSLESSGTAEGILEIVRRENALAFLVHPFYARAHTRLAKEVFRALNGFEVWNYNYQRCEGPSADQYLKLRKWLKPSGVRAVAGLDLHRKEDYGEVYIEIKSVEPISLNLILQKLREGTYKLGAAGRIFDSKGKIQNLPGHLAGRLGSKIKRRLSRLFPAGK